MVERLKLRDYKKLCEAVINKPCMKGYRKQARRVWSLVSDLSLGTQYNHLIVFKKWIEYCRRVKFEPTQFDLATVKDFLSSYGRSTRHNYAVILKKIFVWNGELAELKVKRVDNDLPETLNVDQVNRLVRAAESLKWKTVIRVTYDGALRSHEMDGLKRKHVRFDKYGAEVWVPSSKSQSLWLRLIESVPLLTEWINHNTFERDDYLFPGRDGESQLSHAAFYLALKRISRKARIKQKVTPHILRHSRIGWLKKYGGKYGITDSIICKVYGRWAKENEQRMLSRYGRIDPVDANRIILQAHNKLGSEDEKRMPILEPMKCPRCQCENEPLSKYCCRCGLVLDEKEAARLSKTRIGVERENEKLRLRVSKITEEVNRINKRLGELELNGAD